MKTAQQTANKQNIKGLARAHRIATLWDEIEYLEIIIPQLSGENLMYKEKFEKRLKAYKLELEALNSNHKTTKEVR